MDDGPNINIFKDDDGDYYISSEDGSKGLPLEAVELIFELQKQNPDFYKHWMSLAVTYVMSGNSVLEA